MNDIALLVQCGDIGTRWVPYFVHHYNKNWICDDFIDTVFLFENNIPEIKSNKKNIHIMNSGPMPWGSGMINCLKELKYKHIILVHEDYILTEKQDVKKLKQLINVATEKDMALLKICGDWGGWTAAPKTDIPELTEKENIKKYSLDTEYLTSHQISIWKRDYLLRTINPAENPWSHEIAGTIRARSLNLPVYVYMGQQPIPYCESVTRQAPRPACHHFFEVPLE